MATVENTVEPEIKKEDEEPTIPKEEPTIPKEEPTIPKEESTIQEEEPKIKKEETEKNPEIKSNQPSVEEDDIPDSFFDDFSNNEFMDGLNILDSWDENQTQMKGEDRKTDNLDGDKKEYDSLDNGRYNKSSDGGRHRREYSPKWNSRRNSLARRGRSPYSRSRSLSKRLTISPHRRRSRSRPTYSPRVDRYLLSRSSRDRGYNSYYRRRDRSPYRSRNSRDRDRYRRHSPRRSHEKIEELRRDPIKTKNDIEKDKDKCARAREAKEVEKKITVAESGLCPPGMEDMMDEITAASFKPNDEENMKQDDGNRFSTIAKEVDHLIKFSKEKEIVCDRNSKDQDRNRERDLQDKMRQQNRHRYRVSPMRGRQDNYRGRRQVSPGKNSAERDMDRSDSKRRKRSPFLLELARTLWSEPGGKKFVPNQVGFNPFNSESASYNSTNVGPYGNMQPFAMQQQMLLPTMPQMPTMNNDNFTQSFPPQQFPVVPSFQQFQTGSFEPVSQSAVQSFQSQPFQPVPNPFQGVSSTNQVTVPSPGIVPAPQIFTDIPPANNSQEMISPSASKLQAPTGRKRPNLIDVSTNKKSRQLSKLFEDKKISLSDFLTVSARDETVQCNIQEKIKVLSRCQDAIAALDTTKKSGRFFATSTDFDRENKLYGKWKSPLMKKGAVVKFSFTTPSKGRENEVQNAMKKLLATINFTDHVITPLPPQSFKPETATIISPKTPYKHIWIQTDPFTCQKCDLRNSRKFMDAATQTSNVQYLDEATQVMLSDLAQPQPPLRGILKNSSYTSLSHLTAAQLLEQDKSLQKPNQFNPPPVRPAYPPQINTPLLENPPKTNPPLMEKPRAPMFTDDNFDPTVFNPWAGWKDITNTNPSSGGNITQNMPPRTNNVNPNPVRPLWNFGGVNMQQNQNQPSFMTGDSSSNQRSRGQGRRRNNKKKKNNPNTVNASNNPDVVNINHNLSNNY